MSRKKPLKKHWSVSEKLQVVEARQSGMMLRDISSLYGAAPTTISQWARKYAKGGLAALENAPRGGVVGAISAKIEAAGALVTEIKAAVPEAGVGRVQGELERHGFLSMARETVRRLLRGQGHGPILGRSRRRNRPAKVRSFERALPNELWQTDIMTFMIKGQYRVYLIGFMDDHSRFMVGWGLYRFQTAANVQEVFRAAIEKHGLPKEVLSDNGRQYYSWRGRSQFSEMLTKLGIRHIRSRPYHPQTCGKIESFWRNVIQELLAKTPLSSFEEAKEKLSEYVEYYNFKRPHQGIENVTPSDRFYRVADQVKQIVAANTAKLESTPVPAPEYRPPAYLVGNLGGKELRVVAKEAEVTLSEPSPGKVELVTGGEAHEPSAQRQETAKPAGAAGPDSAGNGQAGAEGGAVREGGGVAGVVLPVDAGGAGGGAQSAGGEAPGPQADGAGEGAQGGAQASGPSGAAGEREQVAARGERALEASGGDGQADHPTTGVGAGPGAGA
jgi:transposase InsO family protein/transposase-like protein